MTTLNPVLPALPASAISAAPFSEDDLLRLEIQIALRADELSHKTKTGLVGDRDQDREHWLRAEGEVFERRYGGRGRR